MATVTDQWQKRIVDTGEESPSALIANPLNYRRHPENQRVALREMLNTVGWVQQVVVNQRTGHLVDGHLRVELAVEDGAESVPVLYVDLDEDEERLVLAALDPLAALAVTDEAALTDLLDGLEIDGDALNTMLADLAPVEVPDEKGTPATLLEAMKVSLADPKHTTAKGDVWKVGTGYLVVVSVYDGWGTYGPLLKDDRLMVPYPTPIVPLTQRARENVLVMVQPDPWLAGHLLDKYTEVHGDDSVSKL